MRLSCTHYAHQLKRKFNNVQIKKRNFTGPQFDSPPYKESATAKVYMKTYYAHALAPIFYPLCSALFLVLKATHYAQNYVSIIYLPLLTEVSYT